MLKFTIICLNHKCYTRVHFCGWWNQYTTCTHFRFSGLVKQIKINYTQPLLRYDRVIIFPVRFFPLWKTKFIFSRFSTVRSLVPVVRAVLRWRSVWNNGGTILTIGNQGNRRKFRLCAPLSTTKITWTVPGSTPSIRVETWAIKHPRHSTAFLSLTLSLLMSYICGAPCKARNFNVLYIWTYVWQRWKASLSICCTLFQHWINVESYPVSQLCVDTLPATKVTLITDGI
jgi:hypothetical protein